MGLDDIDFNAALAAVCLERFNNGERDIDCKSIEYVADYIGKRVMSGDENHSEKFSMQDLWLWKCMYEFLEKPHVSHISGFALYLKLLHEDLSGWQSLQEDRIKGLRDFLILLSGYAMAEKREYNLPHRLYAA